MHAHAHTLHLKLNFTHYTIPNQHIISFVKKVAHTFSQYELFVFHLPVFSNENRNENEKSNSWILLTLEVTNAKLPWWSYSYGCLYKIIASLIIILKILMRWYFVAKKNVYYNLTVVTTLHDVIM